MIRIFPDCDELAYAVQQWLTAVLKNIMSTIWQAQQFSLRVKPQPGVQKRLIKNKILNSPRKKAG
jgi:hypothetical protein